MGDEAITLVDEHAAVMLEREPTLDALFRDHHERVYLAAYRICGSNQDAEDVLQSVFLRLLQRQQDHKVPGNSASYLCRAAINASFDLLRGRSRAQLVGLDDDTVDEAAAAADAGVQSAELRRHLRTALSSLRPRAAEIFALRYFEDFGNHEIAAMLGTSSSSIAVTLHRTRDRLQELLQHLEEGTSP